MESPNAADRVVTRRYSPFCTLTIGGLKITDPDGRLKADLAVELPAMGLSVRRPIRRESSQLGADPHRSFACFGSSPAERVGTDVCQSP